MNKEELASYVKSLRQEKKLSYSKLAALSGVSRTYLTNIEMNRTTGKPSADVLSKIAEPLGVTKEHLMEKAGYLEEKVELEETLIEKTSSKLDLREIITSKNFELYYSGIKLENYQLNGLLKIIDTIMLMQTYKNAKGLQFEEDLLKSFESRNKKMEE
ncbi:helix-turn-helix domain-containing protein [Bacillus sp. AFS017336]|uniref:helix-turn-helix domain-containing protein n=1 Tax=Bacillus sp. AFS017336 TaxID=2033489 RepID=UPI0015CF6AA6|nr:helix-turn-helix transcriptional regulator [Bacillus sp. AFS017336]